jgi:hypothetical protein
VHWPDGESISEKEGLTEALFGFWKGVTDLELHVSSVGCSQLNLNSDRLQIHKHINNYSLRIKSLQFCLIMKKHHVEI